jgi:Putative peptidoglycan binding domain
LATIILFGAQTLDGQQASPAAPVTPQLRHRAPPAGVFVSPRPKKVTIRQSPITTQPAAKNNTVRANPNPTKFASYAEALRRYRHARHTRYWWRRHFTVFVLVQGGYYYWDSGYWCPAWGYDPNYEAYDYDGPIFTYGNLLPDQVIINVQRALKNLGYYAGDVNGSLSPATRRALSAFQQDSRLEVNGIVDESTVHALGLI